MSRPSLLLCALACLPLAAADHITLDKTIEVRQLSDLQFSPDGARVAFTVQEPVSGKRAETHIWVFDTASKDLHQWTSSAKSERMPRWSPDGNTLAFLSDRQDGNQIWLAPASGGGEAVRLTGAKNSVQSFRWSRDGKRIAFLAADPKTDAQEKKEKDQDDAEVSDDAARLTRVWVADIATHVVGRVTSGSWRVTEIEWLPDGKHLIAVATDTPADDRHTSKIYQLSLEGGSMEVVAAPRGPFRGIQVSPSGKAIAYVASAGDGPSPHDLFVLDLDKRTPRDLSASKDRPVQSFQWTNDLDIATLFADGFRTQLTVVGERPAMMAASGSLDIAGFALNKSSQLAAIEDSATSPAELYWEGKAVSHFNDGIRQLALTAPEFYRYSSFDGVPVEAALYRGAGASTDKPQPLVLLIHGGPAGNWRNRFDGLTQLLTARGYTVMQPNIRGSIAYGQKFLESNRGDWGGGDYKDAMAGVDDLVKRGIADPNRLAIAGWSYGGYMAEWAITQTNRFKVAVSGAGMADLAAEYGTELGSAGDEWYYGIPYENLAGFQKSSPIVYIRNAKTPTLILQGEADTTDPLSQSQILYRGLKRYNVPTELVVYPREPHGFREEKHILDRDRRIVDWIDKYLSAAH